MSFLNAFIRFGTSGYNNIVAKMYSDKGEVAQMKADKRVWLMLIVAVFVLLAGCSTGTNNTGSEDAKNAEQSGVRETSSKEKKEEAVIRVWVSADSFNGEESPGQLAAKAFNEENKGEIKVEIKFMPWAELNTAIQVGFSSGDMPDVFQLPENMDLRQAVYKDMISPLDDYVSEGWKEQFYPASFVEGVNVFEGKTYSWALIGPEMNSILYYNTELLKNAGFDEPPQTWDEFRHMSKVITDNGGGDVFGYVIGGATEKTWLYQLAGLSGWPYGTNPEVDWGFNYKTGQYGYDDPAVAESLQFMLDVKNDGSILPASYTLKNPEAAMLFGSGKAAFYIDGRYRMWLLKRDTPDLNFGMTVVPTKDGEQSFQHYTLANPKRVFVLSNSSKYKEEAGKVIEEVLSSESYYKLTMSQGVSLTPIEALNKDESNYPYPEFKTFYELHDRYLKALPDLAIKNPETAQVVVEMGGMFQPRVKPNIAEITQLVLLGEETNIVKALNDYAQKMNAGLADAVQKVKQQGIEVSENDFMFDDWDPTQDYISK